MIDVLKDAGLNHNEHVIAYWAARRDFIKARFERFWQTVKL